MAIQLNHGEDLFGYVDHQKALVGFLQKKIAGGGDPNGLFQRRLATVQQDLADASQKIAGRSPTPNPAAPITPPAAGTPAAPAPSDSDLLKLFDEFDGFNKWYQKTYTPDQRAVIEKQWGDQAKAEADPYYNEMARRFKESSGFASEQDTAGTAKATQDKQTALDSNQVNRGRFQDDYSRITGYANADYAKNLAKVDKGFADTLTKAAVAFGVKNLDQSGLRAKFNEPVREDAQATRSDLSTTLDRSNTQSKVSLDRNLQDLNTSDTNINHAFDTYTGQLGIAGRARAATLANNLDDTEQARKTSIAELTQSNKDSFMTTAIQNQLAKLRAKGENISPSTFTTF